MAIYSFNIKPVQKSKGHSAEAKAKYIQREGKHAEFKKDDLLHKESGNMPSWVDKGKETEFWKTADVYERSNGRTAHSVIAALPNELNDRQKIHLTKLIAKDLANERQPYTFAIHKGESDSSINNPHAHIMVSTRINDGVDRPKELHFKRSHPFTPEKGGAPKAWSMRDKEWFFSKRHQAEQQINSALHLAGHDVQVSSKSLAAQGIDRVPGSHLGPNVLAMEEKGIRTEKGNEISAREVAAKKLWEARLAEARERSMREQAYKERMLSQKEQEAAIAENLREQRAERRFDAEIKAIKNRQEAQRAAQWRETRRNIARGAREVARGVGHKLSGPNKRKLDWGHRSAPASFIVEGVKHWTRDNSEEQRNRDRERD